jgi:hypothetical protein
VTGFEPKELLSISLRCVDREFPYYLEHAFDGPMELHRPAELHPAFYGCFDWHSAVHNHWLLLHIMRLWPELDADGAARRILDAHLNPQTLGVELAYFDNPNNGAFSRPYGWGWLLRVHAEAVATPGPDGERWATALGPLRDALAAKLADYFATRLQFAIRSGLHANSAFSMLAGLDTARAIGDSPLAATLVETARQVFLSDRDYPTWTEPSGGDFLSPALTEAALLANVLEPAEYADWLTAFLPGLADGTDPVLQPPPYAREASDPATVHLNGLLMTKAWAASRIAVGLPDGDPRIGVLIQTATAHMEAASDALDDHHYHATHWIPTFALFTQAAMADAGIGLSPGSS